jgi:hypothetical protein
VITGNIYLMRHAEKPNKVINASTKRRMLRYMSPVLMLWTAPPLGT